MEITIQENSQYGLVVSSRAVAKELGKLHKHVIRDLEKILESPNVGSLNSENANLRSLIIPSTYRANGQNRTYKEYLLTKDGFTLYMFNIQGYQDFKMAYIQKFNEMEKMINSREVLTNCCQKKLSYNNDYISTNKKKNEVEFESWELLKGSVECMNDISKMMNKYIEDIKYSIGRIEDYKTHIYFYSKQVTEMLKEFESRTSIIKTK